MTDPPGAPPWPRKRYAALGVISLVGISLFFTGVGFGSDHIQLAGFVIFFGGFAVTWLRSLYIWFFGVGGPGSARVGGALAGLGLLGVFGGTGLCEVGLVGLGSVLFRVGMYGMFAVGAVGAVLFLRYVLRGGAGTFGALGE